MVSLHDKNILKEKTEELLWSVGVKIESDKLKSVMLKKGCREAATGRVRIPAEIIAEMSDYQKKTQKEDNENQNLHYFCGIDWAHHIIWNGQQETIKKRLKNDFLMSAFDCGPTICYDYRQKKRVPVDTEIFTQIKKFAQATPEIGYISTWYRQDVPPQTERLDSLVLGLKYTDKLDGIEAIHPEVIKYLKEASEIITGIPGNSSYLAGSECITSPLILEKRSAEDILERSRCGIKRYHIASMPTIGVATPVTIAGSVVMGAAELLGGMAACFLLDPDSDLSSRMISMVVDMRTGNSVCTGPEVAEVNLAVRELFDAFWGGHCWVEVLISPSTKEPGLTAVFENLFGAWRTAKTLGKPEIPYPGMGVLGDGGIGSPTQFMLDMEIRKAQFSFKDSISIDENELPFREICAVTEENKEFLSHEHTLSNFRKLWSSGIFDFKTLDEKSILDKCEQSWRDNLKRYQPPIWPAEKIKELEKMLARAKKELLA